MAEFKVISEKCSGCGLCESVCAYSAIEIKNGKAAITKNCCSCGICMQSCNEKAISSMEKALEKAANIMDYSGVWVFCEQRNNKINSVTFELLGEGRKLAKKLKAELSAVLIGSNVEDNIKELFAYGADKVYVLDHPALDNFNDEIYKSIIEGLTLKYKPEIILFGATVYGRSLAPRIASGLNTGLTADCTELDVNSENRDLLQTRPAFGGNLMATIVCANARPQIATVRPRVMNAIEPDYSRKGQVVAEAVKLPDNIKLEVKEVVYNYTKINNLADAEIIVSFGRGIGDIKNIKLIEELAKVLGAAIGASRAVVDCGWIEANHQVGQSGKTVKPKLYFACGISGSIQHLAGMSSSDMIIAINKDPDAPIFKVASYGIVGDIVKVLPALTEEFKKRLL